MPVTLAASQERAVPLVEVDVGLSDVVVEAPVVAQLAAGGQSRGERLS
jgi:hypothetical protein